MDSRFTQFIKHLSARWQLVLHQFVVATRVTAVAFGYLTVVASLVALVSLVIVVGFDHRPHDLVVLARLVKIAQWVFIANVLVGFLFRRSPRGKLGRVVDILVLLTMIPMIWPRPDTSHLPWLIDLIYSRTNIYAVLAAYAAVELSQAVMQIPGRRTNPSLLLSGSFLAMIIVGTLLLMLPKATVGGIGFIDAMFVSTSAVCITGLTPVDVSATFTPLGLAFLAVLIEFGGLGLLTFSCFFALFFSGTSSIYSQLVMRDVVYSKSMSQLLPTLVYILVFTLVLEAIGAVGFYFTFPPELTATMTVKERIGTAVFTSISAFCNAGFSNIPGGFSNPNIMHATGNGFFWVASMVIISGAVGFPLLVNLKDALKARMLFTWNRLRGRNSLFALRPVRTFDMNTRIVAVSFFTLFIFGAVAFFFLEYDNSLAGMSLWQKVCQSVFNSATPRSAGFTSVDPAGFLSPTLLMVMALMWVGGAAQSTAGGVKVNALAAVLLNLRAIVTGRSQVTAFGRAIAPGSIARANAVIAISILAYLAFGFAMLLLEPELSVKEVMFETCSALFTVGSSLGATPKLGPAAEVLLCVAMFLGRVGIVSLMAGIAGMNHSKEALVKLPSDNIIIN